MQQAYGFNQIALPAGETFNDAGMDQTIAIIDFLDDPYIVSDLQTFDETFNIGGGANDPTNTSFIKVVNENGGTTLPPTDQVDYGIETSLDVEWAHAMAPGATILLVEANSASGNDVNTAIEFAAGQLGVSVISMSFGGGEWGWEGYDDTIFTTPLGHQGISFVASAGDSGGFATSYPAISPNVLSVGGTTLSANASGNPDRSLETGWSNGGGGVSLVEAEPAYQQGVQSTGFRIGPDLAYDADLTTGVPVIDTLNANAVSPGKPWFEVGGTSDGAPQISSLIAIANQLRVAKGESTLDGPNQLLPALYQIAAADSKAFQDITSGYNGYAAGPGYDFVTGLGTPNAQYLVSDLVAAYSTRAAPATIYWTGDFSNNWGTPGNWSTVDPAISNVQQSVLPASNDNVVVDLSGATILHDTTNYDTISSFTVTATNVTFELGLGALDLSGGGGRGVFQVDQAGDSATITALPEGGPIDFVQGGILKSALVTSGTTLIATTIEAQYPELNNVEIDGTLDANQNGNENYENSNVFYIQNGLILNGTINLGGSSDYVGVILAGYGDGFTGNQDNKPEAISGSGTIQLGQSPGADGLENWGTLGTFTIGQHITVVGGGPGSNAYFQQTWFVGSLDNQGTFIENGGSLTIQAFGPSLYGWETSGPTGWTNEGTIEATGATLFLFGGWTNSGTISADSASTIWLGNPTSGMLATDPGAAYYGWSGPGSITIGDGASLVVGGFLTTDQYQGAAGIGISADLSLDAVSLDGTLDNSAADNSVSMGVLALNAVTGPLQVMDGTVYGGSITTSGSDDVEVSSAGGWFSSVSNDGTVNLNNGLLTLFNATNNGAINATNFAYVEFFGTSTNNGTVSGTNGTDVALMGTWDNASGSVSVDSSSSLFLGNPGTNAGSAFAWNVSAVGTIDVANGATIVLGGHMTTDQFTAFPSLPGVSINLAKDTVVLDGWIDNSPADNPLTGGVFTISSATGSVNLSGGFIYHGIITTTGSAVLTTGGFFGPFGPDTAGMDGVTNDGTIVSGSYDFTLQGTFINNGSLTLSSFSYFLPGGSLTNNGNIAIRGSFGFFYGSSLTNNGNISVSGGSFDFAYQLGASSQLPASTLTNNGTISATRGGISINGSWNNASGTISIDSKSSLFLGSPTNLVGSSFPPPIADGSPFAWNFNQVGTIDVASGATIGFGGLMTTDQFDAFPHLPGVSITLSQDSVYLTGWLDNSTADNPISHGVLALNSATGPLYLDSGYIYKGKITTSGSNDLEIAGYDGFLDGVELDGTLDVTAFCTVWVLDSMTLNGAINMPGPLGFLAFGYFDNTPEIIRGSGSIFLGGYEAQLFNLSNASLTIGRGITIDAAATYSYLATEGGPIENLGTVEDNSGTLLMYGYNPNTGENYRGFTNAGVVDIQSGATLTTLGGDYSQSAGTTTVDGTLTAANVRLNGGSLNGTGMITATGLYMTGGHTSNDQVQLEPLGHSNTGSTGVQVTATLNGARTSVAFSPLLNTIYIFGFAGNDNISLSATLTLSANISAGNGNDNLQLGDGSNTVTLGNGNYNITTADGNNAITLGNGNNNVRAGNGNNIVTLGNGNNVVTAASGNNVVTLGNGNNTVKLGDGSNTVTLGNGNDSTQLGNGNNVVVEGNGNDNITAGNGDNLIVAGLGTHSVRAGSGSNILIDGSVRLTQSGDSLRQVLDDWMQYGSLAANVASIRSRLAVTYNSKHANTFDAGSGLDWFWYTYAKDTTNRKKTDLLD
jgi:hypothetical protein